MRAVYLSVFLVVSFMTFSQEMNKPLFDSDRIKLQPPSVYPNFTKFEPNGLKHKIPVVSETKNVLTIPPFEYSNSNENSVYQLHTVTGSRYRSKLIKKKLFYDIDWQPGFKKYNYRYIRYPNGGFAYMPDGKERVANMSLAVTLNYKINNNLYVGTGIEPAFSPAWGNKSKSSTTNTLNNGSSTLSVPAIYKIGYIFNEADMSISKKIDFMDKRKSGFQFNLFTPISTLLQSN